MFVIHELTEDVKLLPQELVGEIHLMKDAEVQQVRQTRLLGNLYLRGETNWNTLSFPSTHRGVHYACAVSSDGVGNVTDVDGVQVLVVTCLLYEDLLERRNCLQLLGSRQRRRARRLQVLPGC